ncbi:MAG: hypothetical protein HZB16_19450 [Armatimonadetes bacterium]|nr:hypothetical protein [Armatimonadota bacterium]
MRLLGLASCLMLAATARADVSNDCLVCHSNERLAERDADGKVRSLYVDAQHFFATAHAKKGCLGCHGDLGLGPHDLALGRQPAVKPAFAPYVAKLPKARAVAVANCMGCHEKEFASYQQSVHGEATRAGKRGVPLCDDCHGNHAISMTDDIESPVNPAQQLHTCAKCHADGQVMAQYNVSTNVVKTFEHHFHGRKRLIGDARVAVCTSCHAPAASVHEIRGPKDPKSTVNPANHTEGCGREGCHPGTSEAFAKGFGHEVPSLAVRPLVFLISKIHILMMTLVLGTMFLHILLDIIRRKINASRAAAQSGGKA